MDLNDRTVVERVDPLLGTVIDRRYRIDARIAAGGFGAIYRATHIGSGHEIALKILHDRLAADGGVVARFRREGAALTKLRSPYTIAAYEIGEVEDDGILFIVMELLRGVSLFDRLRTTGPLPWRLLVKIGGQVCAALEEAHRLGIVHRDLKPTNIHLEPIGDDPDHVKVLDFGIAKILQDSEFDKQDLTNAGQMIGTLDYMAPEQMVGGAMSGQTDIYTLGIVMYEMLTGKRPFAEASTAAAQLAAMLRTTPPPIKGVPAALDAIVQKCLAREAEHRYADVAELGHALGLLVAPVEDNDKTTIVVLRPGHGVDDRITAPTMDAAAESTMLSMTPPPPTPRRAAPAKPPPLTTLPGMAPRHAIATADDELQTPRLQGRAPMMDLNQFGQPSQRPPTPTPMNRPTTNYDMTNAAAREANVRRLIWIAVLVIAAVIGIGIAAQL